MFSGITGQEKLGGVFGLSCYMLLSDRIKNYIPAEFPNKKTPFFLAHGLDDDIVPHEFGKLSAAMGKELGLEDVTFKSYKYDALSPLCHCRIYSAFHVADNYLGTSRTLQTQQRLKIWKRSLTRRFLPRARATYDSVRPLGNGSRSHLVLFSA